MIQTFTSAVHPVSDPSGPNAVGKCQYPKATSTKRMPPRARFPLNRHAKGNAPRFGCSPGFDRTLRDAPHLRWKNRMRRFSLKHELVISDERAAMRFWPVAPSR